MAIAARVMGTGHRLPEKVVTNFDVMKMMETTDEFIVTRTGVHQRRHAEAEVSASDLAVPACEAAVADAGLDMGDIDLLIMNTITPDHADPGCGFFLQAKLGLEPKPVLDIKQQCCGLIYGMSAFGLAKQLNIGRLEAQDYIDSYFSRYPGVKKYMENTCEQAHDRGYVETVFGRRLYLPEINSRNGQRRQYAERTAINAPMQGTAADIIKRAMIAVDHALENSKLDAKVVMQVHDELVVEVLKKDVEAVAELLSREMAQAANLKVPLVVDIGTGKNWDEAH